MPKYLITRTIKYTESIEVEADSEEEAQSYDSSLEFESNYDHSIYDERIMVIG